MSLDQIVPVLQLSIGPVILISGVGLVLLSMTNRYGQVIARARSLAESSRHTPGSHPRQLQNQLLVLLRRTHLLRLAITLASTSLLLAAMLIIALFLVALLNLGAAFLIALLFVACMVSLIGGLIVFIIDVNVSLSALTLEISPEISPESK